MTDEDEEFEGEPWSPYESTEQWLMYRSLAYVDRFCPHCGTWECWNGFDVCEDAG